MFFCCVYIFVFAYYAICDLFIFRLTYSCIPYTSFGLWYRVAPMAIILHLIMCICTSLRQHCNSIITQMFSVSSLFCKSCLFSFFVIVFSPGAVGTYLILMFSKTIQLMPMNITVLHSVNIEILSYFVFLSCISFILIFSPGTEEIYFDITVIQQL